MCTGYDIFREQNEVVWREVINPRRRGRSSLPCLGAVFNKTESSNSLVSKSLRASRLSADLEEQAICFFFVNLYPRLLGYYTDEIPHLYGRERNKSVLSQAIVALSFSLTSLHPQYWHFKQQAISKYSECLRLVREGARDPEIAGSDSFLAAVLVLASYEVGSKHMLWL